MGLYDVQLDEPRPQFGQERQKKIGCSCSFACPVPIPKLKKVVAPLSKDGDGALNRRRSPCHALAFTRVRTRVRSYAPARRALPPTPSSPPPSCGVLVRRLDTLLAPTAWRRKFFVRARNIFGPGRKPRYRSAAGEKLGRARVGSVARGLLSNDHAPSLRTRSGPPPLRAQVSAALQDPGRAEIALRRRRCRCRSAWAAPRAKGFLGMASFPKALRRCFSQPPGRKAPAGACAGGSRVTPGGGQAMRAARARWSGRRRARRAAAACLVRR